MKIDFEGRIWQLDVENVDMEQAVAVTVYTGLTLTAWESATTDPENPSFLKALQGLYWLMREQNSEPLPLESANFAVLRFFQAYAAGVDGERQVAAAAVEADPTRSAAGSDAAEPDPAPQMSPG